MRNKKKICKRCARPVSSNLRFCSPCYEARRRERARKTEEEYERNSKRFKEK